MSPINYDQAYAATADYFGAEPEEILKSHYHRLDKSMPVLDIGAGQGRNAFFLAREGFAVDAIDPSKVAIEMVSTAAVKNGLPVRACRSGFATFLPQTSFYSGILIFGLIQELHWESIELLLERVHLWTRDGSLVFVTAFTTDDASCLVHSQTSKAIGRNSFVDHEGNISTYLRPGHIVELFSQYKAIYHWEGIGPEHRHGKGPAERHAKVEAVFRRRHGMDSDIETHRGSSALLPMS